MTLEEVVQRIRDINDFHDSGDLQGTLDEEILTLEEVVLEKELCEGKCTMIPHPDCKFHQ